MAHEPLPVRALPRSNGGALWMEDALREAIINCFIALRVPGRKVFIRFTTDRESNRSFNVVSINTHFADRDILVKKCTQRRH